ncbi:MAG: DUF4160 domain-containing protein [Spirochaetales bacterium]
MPTISAFHGILIRMYTGSREHDPPHIHVLYQGVEASFAIHDCSLLNGTLPVGKRRLVEAWIELRREELLADWDLARRGEALEKIAPLQ